MAKLSNNPFVPLREKASGTRVRFLLASHRFASTLTEDDGSITHGFRRAGPSSAAHRSHIPQFTSSTYSKRKKCLDICITFLCLICQLVSVTCLIQAMQIAISSIANIFTYNTVAELRQLIAAAVELSP